MRGEMVGSIVYDKDSDDERPSLAVVVHESPRRAENCYIGDLDKTVAEVNPDYDSKDRVVEIQFIGGFMSWAEMTYSYPVSRLAVVDPIDEYIREYADHLKDHTKLFLRDFVKRVRATYGTYDDLNSL